jgi:hypothetical protein
MAVNVKPMANGSNPQPAVRSLAEKPTVTLNPLTLWKPVTLSFDESFGVIR